MKPSRVAVLVVLLMLFSTQFVHAAPPVANNDSYTTAFGQQLNVPAPGVLFNDTDPDGNTLSAVIVTVPTNGSITFRPTGEFTYTPNTNFSGTDTFTYRAVDATEQSTPATVTITVGADNLPVAVNDSYETKFETPITVTAPGVLANDRDPNQRVLTAVLGTSPVNGTVALSPTGAFTYTPKDNFSGIDTFTYRASNGTQLSQPATVTITVAANPPPVANNDSYEVLFGQARTVLAPGVLGNDTDPNNDNLSAILVDSPDHGTITLKSNGEFTYTPQTNYYGMDTFTYRASDGSNQSAPATVTLMVLSPAPTNLSIIGSLEQGEVRPTFLWNPPTDNSANPVPVQWYNLVIVKQSDNTEVFNQWYPINDVCPVGGSCSVQPSKQVMPVGLLNGDYAWSVRSWNNNLYSAYAPVDTFSVNVPAPVLPTGFTVSVETGRPILTVPNNVNSTWFQVYIGTDDLDLISLEWYDKSTLACDTNTCTLLPDADPANGSFVVYMQAWGPGGFNQNNPNAWVGPLGFTLNLPPAGLVTPLTTTVSSDNYPTITWEAADNATWYQVWIGTSNFTTWHVQWYPATALTCLTDDVCSITVQQETPLSEGQTYVWYVQAWGPGGISTNLGLEGWQEGVTFTA
ncbi:MAG: hypothetical protein OHK0046_14990 [Anaerolineae bacterium]